MSPPPAVDTPLPPSPPLRLRTVLLDVQLEIGDDPREAEFEFLSLVRLGALHSHFLDLVVLVFFLLSLFFCC